MTDKPESPNTKALPRRSLLIGLPTVGASVALSSASAEAAPDLPFSDDADPRSVRLRDTDHVRTYYALARR